MTVVVSFVSPRSIGSASAIGRVRARENLSVGDTTTNTVQEGEMVVIGNAETSMVAIAWGSSPDADATAESETTSAGVTIPAGGQSYPLEPRTGGKINVKAVT